LEPVNLRNGCLYKKLQQTMPLHEEKNCPRCSNAFECKVGDISHCQCNSIVLSAEERAFAEDRYKDCLCAACLSDLRNRYTFFKEKFLFNKK